MECLYQEVAKEILGSPGKIIAASKRLYKEKNPGNIVVFNGNIFIGTSKIWYGDLDITLSIESLKELALSLGDTIYILYEMDGRYGNETTPLIKNALAEIYPDGKVIFPKFPNFTEIKIN